MIVRLISKDGREIKEIKKTQEITVRNAKKRGLHGIPGNVALIRRKKYSSSRNLFSTTPV
jgi:hypothetical protein